MRTAGEREKILIGRDYHYHPAGELERINDNVRGENQYDYDPAGRLTGYYQTGKNAAHEQFAWDSVNIVTMSYDAFGRRPACADALAGQSHEGKTPSFRQGMPESSG